MTAHLHIRAAGMVTCVGLDAASSCAAMRGRLDGFAETRFMGPDGEWLIGAAVPLPRNWIGVKRMAHLAAGALSDIERQHPGTIAGTPILLCLAEEAAPAARSPTPPPLPGLWPRYSSSLPPHACRSSPTVARPASSPSTAPAAFWPQGRTPSLSSASTAISRPSRSPTT